jgi:predicted XRE-type DNA-binding protein
MNKNRSGVSEALAAIMFSLQRAANQRISYAAMASTLGVSQRAFAEWMRGAREPAAMEALLQMLSMLPDEEVSRVLGVWRARGQAPPSVPREVANQASEAGMQDEVTTNKKSVRKRAKNG